MHAFSTTLCGHELGVRDAVGAALFALAIAIATITRIASRKARG